jgi:tetratricopeptide (TPR) repeat protein
MAVTMYPEHYWAHWSLAHTRRVAGDWAGAEEAFNASIALRPEHVSGYTNRFRALSGQARSYRTWWADDLGFFSMLARDIGNAVANRERSTAYRRALDGLDRAPQPFQTVPMIRWQRYICQSWLGDPAVFDTATSALEAYAAIVTGGISVGVEDDIVRKEAVVEVKRFQPVIDEWMKQPPSPQMTYNLDMALLVAGTRLADGKPEAAAKIAAWVLQAKPDLPRARAILGMTHFQAKRYAEALKEFEAALGRDANNMLALTGRALALEQSGDSAKALEAFGKLVPADAAQFTGPAHVIGLLGQARLFAKLGKEPESRHVLARAREVDPVAADKLAAKLFPAKK